MIYKFVSADCPTAGGREPQDGDERFCIVVPLEHGATLHLEIGLEGLDNLKFLIDQLKRDENEPPGG